METSITGTLGGSPTGSSKIDVSPNTHQPENGSLGSGVEVGVLVAVEETVGVGETVAVGVGVGEGVGDGERVAVGVGVGEGVGDVEGVGVGEGVGDGERVAVAVGVGEGVGDGEGVGVGVGPLVVNDHEWVNARPGLCPPRVVTFAVTVAVYRAPGCSGERGMTSIPLGR